MRRALAARPHGLVLLTSPSIYNSRSRFAEEALRGRLPPIGLFFTYPEAGGLMAYGPNHPDNYRLVARLVDRILRGSRPADVPVERPSKFELVVNLRTALKPSQSRSHRPC
jgi:putative ABC transport system substrate-binding protein